MIDEEVHKIVQHQYQVALEILRNNRNKLDAVSERLLEVETLNRNEFLILMGEEPEEEDGIRPEKPRVEPPADPAGSTRDSEVPPKLGSAPSPA